MYKRQREDIQVNILSFLQSYFLDLSIQQRLQLNQLLLNQKQLLLKMKRFNSIIIDKYPVIIKISQM